jgi:hypothetical protein
MTILYGAAGKHYGAGSNKTVTIFVPRVQLVPQSIKMGSVWFLNGVGAPEIFALWWGQDNG